MEMKLKDLKSHRLFRFLSQKELSDIYSRISMMFSESPFESTNTYDTKTKEALRNQTLEINHQITRSVAEVHRMRSFRM